LDAGKPTDRLVTENPA